MMMPWEIPPPFSPALGTVPGVELSSSSDGPPAFGLPPELELPPPELVPPAFAPPGVVPPGPAKEGGRSPGESSVAKEGVLITPGMGRRVAGAEGESRGVDDWGPDTEGWGTGAEGWGMGAEGCGSGWS